MFQEQDLAQIEAMGTTRERVVSQLEMFRQGVPFAQLSRPCVAGDGIIQVDDASQKHYIQHFDKAQAMGRVLKMVPASGAASRMFKALHAAREAFKRGENPKCESLDTFMENLQHFAFYEELRGRVEAEGRSVDDACAVLDHLLGLSGMNYGNLPKALLSFHVQEGVVRTPIEEHFVEAMAYSADSNGTARIHFTVSPEHMTPFLEKVAQVRRRYEKNGITLELSYSVQKESTNTVAATPDNLPFRDDAGNIVFRPGGHGALIENLDDLKGDIIFIKNVDNVVPDHLKDTTIHYKKVLGGLLIRIQQRLYGYLRTLDEGLPARDLVTQMIEFAHSYMGIDVDRDAIPRDDEEKRRWLHALLNRPVRVCGMVVNQGEPGGGPFWVQDGSGLETAQIVEGPQIDTSRRDQAEILNASTHFNPVDLVCGVRDYNGNIFDLHDFIDPSACFISEKSYQGRPLKALELPGLWNGAMARWGTCFVEVPLITFNPVKQVNDLLREQHR